MPLVQYKRASTDCVIDRRRGAVAGHGKRAYQTHCEFVWPASVTLAGCDKVIPMPLNIHQLILRYDFTPILDGHLISHRPVVLCVDDVIKFQFADDAFLRPTLPASSPPVGLTRDVWREFAKPSFDVGQGQTTWKFSGRASVGEMDGFKSFVLESVVHAV